MRHLMGRVLGGSDHPACGRLGIVHHRLRMMDHLESCVLGHLDDALQPPDVMPVSVCLSTSAVAAAIPMVVWRRMSHPRAVQPAANVGEPAVGWWRTYT
jgi:hypothetical protein